MHKSQLNTRRLSCLVELATGTALLLTPGLAMTLIVGSSLPNGGNQMAQLFGAAIICLGLSCWSTTQSSSQDAMPGIGLTAYNISAASYWPYSPSQAMQGPLWHSLRPSFTSHLASPFSAHKSRAGHQPSPNNLQRSENPCDRSPYPAFGPSGQTVETGGSSCRRKGTSRP